MNVILTNTNLFYSDNLPTVLIKSWPLEADLFDGDLLAGPVPSLYSDDPDASLAAITSDPLKSHWDLQKISKTFFMAETVTVASAVAMLKKLR